jgi:arylsulfatase A-like enzyme
MPTLLSRSLLTIVALFGWIGCTQAQSPKKMNVLFIMSDDMRPDLGCYGHKIVKSPNIDRLAKTGVLFQHAYCQFPLCNPSRSSLLTGRHATSTKVLDNTTYFRDLNPDFVTLPQYFRSLGYVTARVGKIFHGGMDDVGSWTEGGEPRKEKKKAFDQATYKKGSDRIVVLEGNGESHADFKTADKTIALLRKYQDKPFFLACGFTRPHSPPTAPKRFMDLYDPAKVPLPVNFKARPTVPDGYPQLCLTPNVDLFVGRDASEQEAREMIRAGILSLSTLYPLNPGLWKTRPLRNETVYR